MLAARTLSSLSQYTSKRLSLLCNIRRNSNNKRFCTSTAVVDHVYNDKLLTVSIIGKPNVGKSTLFNRLTGTRQAIVSAVPGTTRDRKEGKGMLIGLPFRVIDTGGLDDRGAITLNIKEQVFSSLKISDVILFIVDAREGVTPIDIHYANWLRKELGELNKNDKTMKREILLVANKAEGLYTNLKVIDTLTDALRLGLGNPLPLSAAHGDGIVDLSQELINHAKSRGYNDGSGDNKKPKFETDITMEERTIQLAIMGRPNVGKSTLLNAFVNEDRVITGPIPGLTRDSIHVEWKHNDRNFRLVDTAGLTRVRPDKKVLENKTWENEPVVDTNRIKQTPNPINVRLPGIDMVSADSDPSQFSYKISELALVSALNALRFAQVVLLVVESTQGKFSKVDLQLARRALEEGRGLVVAANKRDLVKFNGVSSTEYENGVRAHVSELMKEFGDVPVIACSALEKEGVTRILTTVISTHDAWHKRLSTWILNKWLKDLLVSAPSPKQNGRNIQVKYMTQVKSRPPTFALFCNMTEIPGFYDRFLRSKLQEDFKLQGVPIRFVIRKTKGRDPKMSLLNKGQNRRGVGRGEGRPVGPDRFNKYKVELRKKIKLDRRKRDTRTNRLRKNAKKDGKKTNHFVQNKSW